MWERLTFNVDTDEKFTMTYQLSRFSKNQDKIQKLVNILFRGYSSPGRFYHGVEHICNVLRTLKQYIGILPEDEEIAPLIFAIYFHDFVYRTRLNNNVARSALYAQKMLRILRIPRHIIRETIRLIMLTEDHRYREDDELGKIIVFLDLSILGSSGPIYNMYVESIEKEYSWVDPDQFNAARISWIEDILKRNPIIPIIRNRDVLARKNLQMEMERRK